MVGKFMYYINFQLLLSLLLKGGKQGWYFSKFTGMIFTYISQCQISQIVINLCY